MQSATVRAKLQDPFSVMIHFFLPQRSFGSWRKTDFFNRIGPKRTLKRSGCFVDHLLSRVVEYDRRLKILKTRVDFRRWPGFVFGNLDHARALPLLCFSNDKRRRLAGSFRRIETPFGSGPD